MKRLTIYLILCASLTGIGVWASSSKTPTSGEYTHQAPRLEQPFQDGDKLVFEGGVLYRRNGCVPQLIVAGTHFQMGKQYGVLLRQEIKHTVDLLDYLFASIAREKGIPLWMVNLYVRFESAQIAAKLPTRFKDEIRGVAAGSGLPYQKILVLNMIYDLSRLTGCTTIFVKNSKGEIYHGHTTDIGWGLDWPATIIVQHHPEGFNSFTSVTWPGFLGTQTAYNSKGLCYSENTLTSKKNNFQGFSVNYLARIIMEECSSLNEIAPILNKYATVNGEALEISDLTQTSGAIYETTPRTSPDWACIPMHNGVSWGINLYQYPEFAQDVQDNYTTSNGFNAGRRKIMENYFSSNPEKLRERISNYSVDDLIAILRSSTGPDGKDYAKNAYLSGVCNPFGQQLVLYDPQGQGVYLATGNFFASRNKILFYPDDFSKTPYLYKEAVPLEPAVFDAAILLNMMTSSEDRLNRWLNLSEKYPNEAFIKTYAGWAAFWCGKKAIWADQISKAYQLDVDSSEYKVDQAMVAFYQKDYPRIIDLLKNQDSEKLASLQYQALKSALLEKAYRVVDPKITGIYIADQDILYKNNKQLKVWVKKMLKNIQAK